MPIRTRLGVSVDGFIALRKIRPARWAGNGGPAPPGVSRQCMQTTDRRGA
jgi:hypothetical protein